ncbi:MAG: anti-sigma factor domain-containing protein, partial [Chloroflexota bacterium]
AWTVAAAGWLVSAALLTYSHGLSDRIRLTHDSDRSTLAGVKAKLAGDATLRDYVISPNLSILPLKNWVSATSKTRVTLLTRPGSSEGIVLADKLAPPPSGEVYVVWLKPQDQRYHVIGAFTTNADGKGMAIVNSRFPLSDFPLLGVSVEPSPAPTDPTSPMLFTVSLGTPSPVVTPTSVPTATPALPPAKPATARPRATVRRTPAPVIRLPRLP